MFLTWPFHHLALSVSGGLSLLQLFLYQTVDGCHGNPASVKLYRSNVIACITDGRFRFPAYQNGESFAIKHMENVEMNDRTNNVIALLFRTSPDKSRFSWLIHTILNSLYNAINCIQIQPIFPFSEQYNIAIRQL